MAAYHAFIFGHFTVLKKCLFWSILHVSFRSFHGLGPPYATSCYISLLFPILACLVSLPCFCFWPFYSSGNSPILAHSTCFIQGLWLFGDYFAYLML
ncbi:unnamed protein product [Camellia sinensis]